MAATTTGQPIPSALAANFRSASWIWTSESNIRNPPAGVRAFRKTYTPPAGKTASSALVLMTVDNQFSLFINGQLAGESPKGNQSHWQSSLIFNVALNPGSNLFAVQAENLRDDPNGSDFGAAGILASIQIIFSDGTTTLLSSDSSWRSIKTVSADFASPSIDDSPWDTSTVVDTYGNGAWGSDVILPSGNIPALITFPTSTITTSSTSP